MKVHILYSFMEGPWGGGNQFLKALRDYFRRVKVYSENPEDADVILVNSHHFFGNAGSLESIRKIKNKMNALVIHRVDGPIFRVRGIDSDLDKIIFNFNQYVADGTIFQSKWSQNKCYSQGMKHNDFETVITNAPDPNIFYPPKDRKILKSNEKIKLIATSWSPNPRRGFNIYEFLDNNLDFNKYEVTFVGNSPIEFKRIKYISPQKSSVVADLIRKHDVFITASINDPCSNSLIEALHCGLPAIVRNSGGHTEIVGNGGITFEGTDDILAAIDELSKNLYKYKKAIDVPNMNVVGESYYNFFKEVYILSQKGSYKPKKFKLFDYLRLNLKVYW